MKINKNTIFNSIAYNSKNNLLSKYNGSTVLSNSYIKEKLPLFKLDDDAVIDFALQNSLYDADSLDNKNSAYFHFSKYAVASLEGRPLESKPNLIKLPKLDFPKDINFADVLYKRKNSNDFKSKKNQNFNWSIYLFEL